MGKKKKAAGGLEEHLQNLPPPEDRKELEVLPGVLIHVFIHPDHFDADAKPVDWPAVAAVAPELGDKIVANDQATVGEVLGRYHRIDPTFGPILSLAVRVVEVEF